MRNYFENDYTSYSFQDGVLHIKYHPNVQIDLPAAVQIVKDRLILHEGRTLPILCDVRGVKDINKSARTYFALEGSVLVKAVAMLVEPQVTDMMIAIYIRTNNPPIPTRSFFDKEAALEFLATYRG